uniref:JNK1/MAPK8-associated membrane protein n=1 Tax=Syphacia muris TaxID=451379 RepID=A0A0N5AQK7_9BILA
MVDNGSREQEFVSSLPRACPGFCGRIVITSVSGDITYSQCQACNWGSRSWGNGTLCTVCLEPLPLYDWLYLLFIAVIPLLFHSLFIYMYTSNNCSRKLQFAHYMSCFVECSLSSVLSLLVVSPKGSLHLYGCRKWSLREWYPVFYNPIINHSYTLRCAHEVVFPLYSLPFIYFGFCSLALFTLRSFLYFTVFRKSYVNSKPYYAALHTLPLLALVHFFFAGLLYYSFPFITLICSLIINAVHMALVRGRRISTVCKRAVSHLKNVLMLFVHIVLFGFSLVVLMLNFSSEKWFLIISVLCLPLPLLYYCFMAGLSHPKFVHYFL